MTDSETNTARQLSDIEIDQVSGGILFHGNPIPILPAPPPVPPGLIS